MKYPVYLLLLTSLLLLCSGNFRSVGSLEPDHISNELSQSDIRTEMEKILDQPNYTRFNGTILISEKGKTIYSLHQGFADLNTKTGIDSNSRFIIGSISKQMTAVLLLLEWEAGRVRLEDKISRYLPDLQMSWKDSVTVYNLLTHSHAIVGLDKPLAFMPGTRMDYERGNHFGYLLLSQIIEKTSKTSFAKASARLFKRCKMKNTYHPDSKPSPYQVKGYECLDLKCDVQPMRAAACVAAGGFISTARDLLIWNKCLHSGRLLKQATYKMMTTKQAHFVRQHRVSGPTEYGLGMTVKEDENIVQYGQTGYAPGYASMNFYFPESDISVIMLVNVVDVNNGVSNAFVYHKKTLDMVRAKLRHGRIIAEKAMYRDGHDSLPYRILYPANFDYLKRYPVLVYLHGSGSRGIDNEKPLSALPAEFLDSVRRLSYPCFILIPQCPENDVWVKFPDFPYSLNTTGNPTQSSTQVLRLLHYLIESKSVDSNRIYLTGYSMGGEGTFDLLSREPRLFACGVPLASVADTSVASVIKEIPIRAFHGTEDKVNEIKYVRLMIEQLKKWGSNAELTELEGLGHNCQKQVYGRQDLWAWIFEQHK